jgi:hypothetical protein
VAPQLAVLRRKMMIAQENTIKRSVWILVAQGYCSHWRFYTCFKNVDICFTEMNSLLCWKTENPAAKHPWQFALVFSLNLIHKQGAIPTLCSLDLPDHLEIDQQHILPPSLIRWYHWDEYVNWKTNSIVSKSVSGFSLVFFVFIFGLLYAINLSDRIDDAFTGD